MFSLDWCSGTEMKSNALQTKLRSNLMDTEALIVKESSPGTPGRVDRNTSMPGWWHSWFWKTNMWLSVINISIVGHHLLRKPRHSSSPSVFHAVPPPSPSSFCPILFRMLVVDWSFGVSTPQTAQYRQKFDGGFAECFRIRRSFCGPSRTSALMWITFIYLHHSIWSPLHHLCCFVPSC